MNAPVVASAPASSANLGPGFDVLALALELRCEVEAAPAESWSVTHTGAHRPEAEAGDAVLTAAKLAVGEDSPLHLGVDNAIPLGKGLGSSAAALAAGTAAAWRCVEGSAEPQPVYERVAEIEGHCDNAAAAVFGGLVACGENRTPTRLDLHNTLQPVLLIPDARTYTKDSRNSIPGTYDRDVTVRTISRVAHLIAGLTTGDTTLLDGARGDEVHEWTRRASHPLLDELMTVAAAAGAAHVAVSGSGPTVLALVTTDTVGDFEDAMGGVTAEVRPLSPAGKGLL